MEEIENLDCQQWNELGVQKTTDILLSCSVPAGRLHNQKARLLGTVCLISNISNHFFPSKYVESM